HYRALHSFPTRRSSDLKTERFIPSTPGQECEMSDNEDYITTISFNNFIFNVKIRSTTTDKISYSFEQRENNYPKYVFDVYEIPVNAFTDFYFKVFRKKLYRLNTKLL